MPADKKKKEQLEKMREEADRVAQQQTLNNIEVNNFPKEKAIEVEEEVPAVTDVESVMKAEDIPENVSEKSSEVNESSSEFTSDRDAEEYVMQTANENFLIFLDKEKEQLDKSIELIKKSHPQDYDAYIDSLRKTKYYQKCLEKWQKYYADKRAEFENKARLDIKAMDIEAQKEALNSQKVEEKVYIQPKAKQPFTASKQSQSETYKLKVADMKLDPDLYYTVEQILLGDLRTAFDEYRDFYENQNEKISRTSNSKIAVAMRQVYGNRLDLLNSLVNSFGKIFYTTGEKTVYDVYPTGVNKLKKRLETKKDNMDISTVGDYVMNAIYSYDTLKEEATGYLPELAKYLTLKVQEQLVRKGKFGNFNLIKDDAKLVMSEIVKKYGSISKILLSNSNSQVLEGLLSELIGMNRQLTKDINNGTNGIQSANIDEFSNALDYSDYLFGEKNSELINVLNEQSEELKNILEAKGKLDEKTLLKMLEAQKEKLVSVYDYNYRANKSSYEFFEKTSAKKFNTRPLIDKMLLDLIQKVGAESSRGKIREFAITEEDSKKEVENLVSFVDENKDIELSISEDLLNEMIVDKHDLRERFEKVQSKMSKEAQNEADLIGELIDSQEKDVAKFINKKIDESVKSSKGKQRKKHILVEEKSL